MHLVLFIDPPFIYRHLDKIISLLYIMATSKQYKARSKKSLCNKTKKAVRCNRLKGCKVANGKKRTFCRKKKNHTYSKKKK